jgi:hypothetical protein
MRSTFVTNKDNLGIPDPPKTVPTYLPAFELHKVAMVGDVEIWECPDSSYAAS